MASLSIDTILGEVTICQRKELEEMIQGNGLSDAYTTTITTQSRGVQICTWIKGRAVSYSERPLRAEEPCHAFGVEIQSADLDTENVPALRTLVASCLGLVTVEASSFTFRLVHFIFRTSLISSIRNGEGGLAEMQFTGDHPDADVSNTPLSADCNEYEVVLDFTGSGSGDSDWRPFHSQTIWTLSIPDRVFSPSAL